MSISEAHCTSDRKQNQWPHQIPYGVMRLEKHPDLLRPTNSLRLTALVEAAAIRGASIIGQPGGWCVMLKLGMLEKPLGTQRTDKPRLWRSLDRCIEYVTSELHLYRFDLLDATHYSHESVTRQVRPDAAARLRKAHAAVNHPSNGVE